jgi:hypothetical protein
MFGVDWPELVGVDRFDTALTGSSSGGGGAARGGGEPVAGAGRTNVILSASHQRQMHRRLKLDRNAPGTTTSTCMPS